MALTTETDTTSVSRADVIKVIKGIQGNAESLGLPTVPTATESLVCTRAAAAARVQGRPRSCRGARIPVSMPLPANERL